MGGGRINKTFNLKNKVMQTIVFFLALISSVIGVGYFIIQIVLASVNRVYKNLKYPFIWVLLACILWSVLYYLHLN